MAAAPTAARPHRTATRPSAAALLEIIDATVRDLRPLAPGLPAVTLDSSLEGDLGFDSLTRTELLVRIERGFGIRLPDDTLRRAESVADLLAAAETAEQRDVRPPAHVRAGAAVSTRRPRVDEGGRPVGFDTLLGALDWHLRVHPDQIQVTCLDGDEERALSHRWLATQADAIAAGLQRTGLRPRQCVAIMLPTSPEYFSTYLGILRIGAIPVPIYPPARPSQIEDHVLRHAGILANAQAALLVTVPEAMVVARLLQARVVGLRHVVTAQRLAEAGGGRPDPVPLRGDDIAFIQYTSGSTGQPKGVALTHANLLANIDAMARVVQIRPEDVFVSWLPLYHDMGLIGAWLGGLVAGYPLVVMSPLAFLARPERWLQTMHRYRGTLSAAPNFAYDLCVKRIDDAALAGLDLSAWRIAFNGAEAVSPETLARFEQRFREVGLRPNTVLPVYGLAEAGLGLLFPPPGRGARIDRVERETFGTRHEARPSADDEAGALRFVSCGSPLPDHAVRIVDDAGHELGDRIEGRLEFRGPSATQGYFRNAEQTARLFDGDWLDTGDRAYRADGEVFVTGRVKDIVIRAGRNLYPEEIEVAVGRIDGVRKGCVVAFGSPDPSTGTERLVVLAEVHAGDAAAHAGWQEAAARAVQDAIGEPADEIVLVPPHTVLKTSSGKVRRSACRARYEAGTLAAALPSARRQLFRLAGGAAMTRWRQATAAVVDFAHGLRAVLGFGLLAPLAAALTACLPGRERAWRLNHRFARALLRVSGIRLVARGLARLPAGPCVLVCNHGSYIDGIVLTAALPRPFSFVAKRELAKGWLLRSFLSRLGAEFVDRVDLQRGVADTARLVDRVREGRSLIVFPEGTFGTESAMREFRLGAFVVAVRAGVPIVPVALRGARELLPGGTWWPRRSALEVEVCDPLEPDADADADADDELDASQRLRIASLRAIARRADAT